MYAGPWRHARSLTVGAVCVALSVAGHLAGGGSAPDLAHAPVAALGLVVVTALLCLALGVASRRRWTFGRAVLALGLGQAVLHAAFALVLVPAGPPADGCPQPCPAWPAWPGMAAGAPLWSSGSAFSMAAGHTVAALAVAAVIARTDSALAMWFTVSAARTLARRAVRRVVRAVGAAARSAEEHLGSAPAAGVGRMRLAAAAGAASARRRARPVPPGTTPAGLTPRPRALATHHACVLPASTDATKGLPCSCSIAPSGACSVVPARPASRRRSGAVARPPPPGHPDRRRARRRHTDPCRRVHVGGHLSRTRLGPRGPGQGHPCRRRCAQHGADVRGPAVRRPDQHVVRHPHRHRAGRFHRQPGQGVGVGHHGVRPRWTTASRRGGTGPCSGSSARTATRSTASSPSP